MRTTAVSSIKPTHNEEVGMDAIAETTNRAIPWNKGRVIGQKLPLKLKEIWAIRIRLQLAERLRDLALFGLPPP